MLERNGVSEEKEASANAKKEKGIHETFEERILRLEKAKDYHGLSRAYYEKAVMLYDNKEQFVEELTKSKKCELRYWKENGMEKVSIISENGCQNCKRIHGKTFTIDEALKEMPLPNKDCSYIMNPETRKPFCRCMYIGLMFGENC